MRRLRENPILLVFVLPVITLALNALIGRFAVQVRDAEDALHAVYPAWLAARAEEGADREALASALAVLHEKAGNAALSVPGFVDAETAAGDPAAFAKGLEALSGELRERNRFLVGVSLSACLIGPAVVAVAAYILTGRAETKADRSERSFQGMFEHSADPILVTSALGGILDGNPAARAFFDMDRDDFTLSVAPLYGEINFTAEPRFEVTFGGKVLDVSVHEVDGTYYHTLRDVTARRRLQEEREAFQQRVIAEQQQTIYELANPIIPVLPGVLVMPLTGTIDTARAAQIMEAALRETAAANADHVIIDLTGVAVVDTAVAAALIRTANALRLVGARCVLAGITPGVAESIVMLGIDLRGSGLETVGTLQDELARLMNDAAPAPGR